MYGAMREHAPRSTRLAGALTAATATLAFGYAMANGMGAYIVSKLPDPIIYVPLQDTPTVEIPTPTASELDTVSDRLVIVDVDYIPTEFAIDEKTIIAEVGTEPRREIGPVIPLSPGPPVPIRTRAKLIPAPSPTYPPIDIRMNHEGASALEVCLDTGGRVTSANLASSSGYSTLDQAALKWVLSAKFTPAKLDGRPQSICGHPVVYEWTLNRR